MLLIGVLCDGDGKELGVDLGITIGNGYSIIVGGRALYRMAAVEKYAAALREATGERVVVIF